MAGLGRRPAFLAALGVFFLLLFRPAYMARLRGQAEARMPEYWSKLPTNGRFRVPLPILAATRYHDEALYAARVRQILIHGVPRNPYWRDDPFAINWVKDCLPFYLLAAVAFAFGGDLTLAWTVSVALFGALWFLLAFVALRWWSGRDAVALPLALFSALFPDFYLWLLDVNFNPGILLERWSSVFFHAGTALLPEGHRLPFTHLSFLLVAALFWWTWRLLWTERASIPRFAALGLGYGAMVLVHPFEFLFVMMTLLVLWLAAMARKAPVEQRWNLTVACLASAVLPLGFAALLLFGVDERTRRESVEMVGSLKTHKFYLTSLIHVLAAWLGGRALAREAEPGRRAAWWLLVASQLAAFVLRNAQVVMGFHLSPFHYIHLGSLTGGMMGLLWLSGVLAKRAWWERRLATAACAGLVALALAREKAAAEATYLMFGLPRDTDAALAWAAREIPKDGLVLTLSIATTKNVALFTKGKLVAPPGDSNVAGLFTDERFLGSVARLLKTCRADPDRFLAERWVLPERRAEVFRRVIYEQNLLHTVDLAAFETVDWFYPYLHRNASAEKVLEGRRLVKELYAKAEPVPRPFHLWVDAGDERFLTQDPASFGGTLAYVNDSVKVYRFE